MRQGDPGGSYCALRLTLFHTRIYGGSVGISYKSYQRVIVIAYKNKRLLCRFIVKAYAVERQK